MAIAKNFQDYAYDAIMVNDEDETYNYLRYECSSCKHTEQKINDAKEYLQGILNALYSSQSLDIGMLESNLDELCHVVGIRPNLGELQIQRKEKVTKIQKVTKNLSFIAN